MEKKSLPVLDRIFVLDLLQHEAMGAPTISSSQIPMISSSHRTRRLEPKRIKERILEPLARGSPPASSTRTTRSGSCWTSRATAPAGDASSRPSTVDLRLTTAHLEKGDASARCEVQRWPPPEPDGGSQLCPWCCTYEAHARHASTRLKWVHATDNGLVEFGAELCFGRLP